MLSWIDLEHRFRRLQVEADGLDLNVVTTSDREHFDLQGGATAAQRELFSTLSSAAGQRLGTLPPGSVPTSVMEVPEPYRRWLVALRHVSGHYRVDMPGSTLNSDGQPVDHIFIGAVRRVGEVSANLCLRFAAAAADSLATATQQLLSDRGFSGAAAHWRKTTDQLAGEEPDLAVAAAEAIKALEAVAKAIVDDPNATLGECLKRLRGADAAAVPLLLSLENLWGYTSSMHGVRHGARDATQIPVAEADFVIRVSEAGMRLLCRAGAV